MSLSHAALLCTLLCNVQWGELFLKKNPHNDCFFLVASTHTPHPDSSQHAHVCATWIYSGGSLHKHPLKRITESMFLIIIKKKSLILSYKMIKRHWIFKLFMSKCNICKEKKSENVCGCDWWKNCLCELTLHTWFRGRFAHVQAHTQLCNSPFVKMRMPPQKWNSPIVHWCELPFWEMLICKSYFRFGPNVSCM